MVPAPLSLNPLLLKSPPSAGEIEKRNIGVGNNAQSKVGNCRRRVKGSSSSRRGKGSCSRRAREGGVGLQPTTP